LHGLDQLLREQELQLRHVYDRTLELERRLDQTEQRLSGAVRHVKVLRFNPFRDTGGDQSFVIALLDDAGTGVVITGLHSRTETRIYAKQVNAGGSRIPPVRRGGCRHTGCRGSRRQRGRPLMPGYRDLPSVDALLRRVQGTPSGVPAERERLTAAARLVLAGARAGRCRRPAC